MKALSNLIFAMALISSFSFSAAAAAAKGSVVLPGGTNIYDWSNTCPDMKHLSLYFKDRTLPHKVTTAKVLGTIRCSGVTLLYVFVREDYGMVNANDVIWK